ncbi:Pimeloyl-ACP methyl ester carboxylesterase [Streptosporangium subroseum]|uniref:Pimeloyl-ACP methyl ester carboxylesterase n=1 Tax=Streptosporangium subroseum TaxID=106412 RepID=A0A239NLX6_9ACTN|nr:alpha/beta hydrolase [Streptosporangium subroseum]SNT55770.1 Pimeloyl-ACP methyl ester carboxylesterase [Streptosporangium subroseum]
MSEQPVIVLVHGAFAESASWNRVIRRLHGNRLTAVAVANPLRSVEGDAAYLRDVIAGIGRPVVLVGHSYGGMVITQAAAGNPAVRAMVYVAAFAPEPGESALLLSGKFEGSSLGGALVAYPVASGGNEFRIAEDKFHHQFCADLDADEAALMAATQRPVTEQALSDGLAASEPGWRTTPSWFVHGERDLNIPAAALRFMAERAGSRGTREIPGASHALAASQPDAVTAAVLDAADHGQE